jgi:hypothetical protein
MVAGQSGFPIFMYLTVGFQIGIFIHWDITVHKLLEDTHEVSIAKTKTNQSVPVQLFGRAFEGVRTPRSVS